ncbi:MAG: M10 family metallopeptidase C-terminal domain-containing protein [Rhizobiaceae bacterium]|nr:M10 family metallopeptidase C-terminal domain-containing protein [Rhizobiaceae bacterium]
MYNLDLRVILPHLLVGSDTVTSAVATAALVGFEGDDTLSAMNVAEADTVFVGGRGSDTFNGGLGADTLVYTGVVADLPSQGVTLNAETGNAVDPWGFTDKFTNIEGFVGSIFGDTLLGSSRDEWFDGGAGGDIIDGGDGIDTVKFMPSLGDGQVYTFGYYPVTVDLSQNYAIDNFKRRDTLYNVENIVGTADISFGGDKLTGNDGANVIDGNGGIDTMTGLKGDDTYHVYDMKSVIVEKAGEGTKDTVLAHSSYDLVAGVEVESLRIYDPDCSCTIHLYGNEFSQEIIGNQGDTILSDGGKGGADTLRGLGGNDTYRVYNSGDVIFEGATEGTSDTVQAYTSYALGKGVYIETLKTGDGNGSAAIDLTGNELAQTITGNKGINFIRGNGGADTMTGGAGGDTFVYASRADSTYATAGRDLIKDFTVGTDKIDLALIDANTLLTGNQDFLWIGKDEFTGVAGELRYATGTKNTVIYGDANGNKAVDFAITLTGIKTLSELDFLGIESKKAAYGGHLYEVIDNGTPLAWLDAAQKAKDMGGHLATISSEGENDFVFGLIKDHPEYWSPGGGYGSYLGGYRPLSTEGPVADGWKWVTGEAFSFTKWSPNEPNSPEETVLHYIFPEKGTGVWNNMPPEGNPNFPLATFIVEYDGLSSIIPTTTELFGPV